MSRRLYPLLRKDNILLLAGGGVETVIGLQALSGERSFLEIVWSGAGDISSPNNILGFDSINGQGHRPGQDSIESNWIGYWYGPTGRRDPYAFFSSHAALGHIFRNTV